MDTTPSTTAKTVLKRLAIMAAVLILTGGLAKLVDIGLNDGILDRPRFEKLLAVYILVGMFGGGGFILMAKTRSLFGWILAVGSSVLYFVWMAVSALNDPDAELVNKVPPLALLGIVAGLAGWAAAWSLTAPETNGNGDQ